MQDAAKMHQKHCVFYLRLFMENIQERYRLVSVLNRDESSR